MKSPRKGSAAARVMFSMNVVEKQIYAAAFVACFEEARRGGFRADHENTTPVSEQLSQWENGNAVMAVSYAEDVVHAYRCAAKGRAS